MPRTQNPAEEEEEDDYLSMTFSDAPVKETPLQRLRREKAERLAAGHPKSKSELAREAAEKREAALSKSLLSPGESANNKGLKMMKAMGFTPGRGLGKTGDAPLEPIGVEMKEDRAGIGHLSEQKRKFNEAIGDIPGAKRAVVDPQVFRDRVRAEKEEKRKEGQFYGAQKVCERLDLMAEGVGEADIGKARAVPLRSINVLWRGLVKYREANERDRRLRYDMEQGLGQPRLPGYDKLHELDEDDKIALGLKPAELGGDKAEVFVEDVEEVEDEEDDELAEFEALPAAEKLDKIVDYLRQTHRYCFWCKYAYDTDEMEGCPGTDEDSHG